MIDYKNCKYEWDKGKNSLNIEKHKVSFSEAKTAFFDEYAVTLEDLTHSTYDENRLFLIGMSKRSRLLLVCHCIRFKNTVRIISARQAGPDWVQIYEDGGEGFD